MIATYVEDQITPYTFEEVVPNMKAALANYLTGVIPINVLALALAKTALETGRWGQTAIKVGKKGGIHNHNWGNIKMPETTPGMYTLFRCNEVFLVNGKYITKWYSPDSPPGGEGTKGTPSPVPPGHPQCRFQAFANITDGAYSYIDFIASRTRYKAAWYELIKGDAIGYCKALKDAGYYTAKVEEYSPPVVSMQKEFISRLQGMPAKEVHVADDIWHMNHALDDLTVKLYNDLDFSHKDTIPDTFRNS